MPNIVTAWDGNRATEKNGDAKKLPRDKLGIYDDGVFLLGV
jgi:hypothetical protein